MLSFLRGRGLGQVASQLAVPPDLLGGLMAVLDIIISVT